MYTVLLTELKNVLKQEVYIDAKNYTNSILSSQVLIVYLWSRDQTLENYFYGSTTIRTVLQIKFQIP